jgi:predicted transcriptional regulator of viral defense system
MKVSNPEDRLLFVRDRTLLAGDDGSLRRRAARGELHRLNHGVYSTRQDWLAWNNDEKYRARVFAVALSRRDDPVVSHYSAAAVWRLPIVGAWPVHVHLLTEKASGGRSHDAVRRHAVGFEHAAVTFVDGIRVTSAARTVVDVAATAPFMSAVAATDHALHTGLTTKKELAELLYMLGRFRGSARAARVVEFSTPLAESVAESASRVTMARCRFPEPELQKEFWGPNGEHAFVDFWFRGVKRIGEVDGRAKYEDPEFLRGRTPEKALWEEKRREDWLRRSCCDDFGRWDWGFSVSPRLLTQRLLETGVPQVPPNHPDAFRIRPLTE